MSKKGAGFTLPELIVVIVVMTVLGGAILSTMTSWLGQYAITSARRTMTVDTQSALARMNDDIRQSYGVLIENEETDPNAPSPPDKWNTDSTHLILAKTPHQADGSAIYDAPEFFSGKPDSIVYYVRNNTLYRRVIPANYPGNISLPNICVGNPGCDTDLKVLSNVSSVSFTYYDSDGASGASPTNTESVLIVISTTSQQFGQTISAQDSIRVNIQHFANLVPPLVDGDPDDPPGPPPQLVPALTAGPGGLQANFTNTSGRDIYVKGRFITGNLSKTDVNGYRVDIANIGCGPRATFPVSCAPAQPIALSFSATITGTPICATGQSTMSGLTGALLGCTAPTVNMPIFNKTAFTSSMTSTIASASCNIFGSINIAAKTTVTGNVAANFCPATFNGNAYIKGNLTAQSTAEIRVAEGITVRPIIVVNGRVDVSFSKIKANSLGILPYIISFYSPNLALACPTSDTCNTITNADIYDAVTSATAAINVTGISEIEASLYAYFGTISLNSSDMTGAIAGQKIILGNNTGLHLITGEWPV